jgi:hypothetical protein
VKSQKLKWPHLFARAGVFVALIVGTSLPVLSAEKRSANAENSVNGPGSISGVWMQSTQVLISTLPARERLARTVDGKLPPLLPAAAALVEQRMVNADKNRPFANSASLCLPQGIPYMLFGARSGPIQILETPGQVTILSEELGEHWLIYLTGAHPKPSDLEPTYHGDSLAKWLHGSLVVDTVGVSVKTTLDQVGTPHSDALHVTTEIRRVDSTTLEFLFTFDDPKTFAAPWKRSVQYKRAKSGERIEEEVCEAQHIHADAEGYQVYDLN